MNLLSATSTAAAGAVTTFIVSTETALTDRTRYGAIACGLLAGLMCSSWANATETEVYAVSLLHVGLMLACAAQIDDTRRGARWTLLTAYVIALAPALHLSALVGAPAAIALAARGRNGRWAVRRVAVLVGVLVATAGLGRMSPTLITVGVIIMLASISAGRRDGAPGLGGVALLLPLAGSALLILLLRARLDPAINQGDPATLGALDDAVARRQYAVAGLLPRQAPAWLQAANVAQYVDWQVAMGWGRGIFTTPARVAATVAYVALGVLGWRAMRRDAARLAGMLVVLVVCGTVGVAAYLNLKAGASLGGGVLAGLAPQEARERDYFFVLGFWGWACFAAWGALAASRRLGRPWLVLAVTIVPLVANWPAVNRSRDSDAGAARRFALALLTNAPSRAVLFTSGDNDTYPLWYLQQAEQVRRDVQVVTLPLLPAAWYEREIGRRTGLRWGNDVIPVDARFQYEITAARIAAAASVAGRPVGASAALSARERSLLGDNWTLRGAAYWAGARASGHPAPSRVDSVAARRWIASLPAPSPPRDGLPDDVASMMLGLLECPRLGVPWPGTKSARDSLEVSCNFR
jgi:hypothetical protein